MTSLRSYLARRVALGVAVVLLIAGLLADYNLSGILNADLDQAMLAKANTLASLVTYQDGKLDIDWGDVPPDPRSKAGRYDVDTDMSALFDEQGRHLWGSDAIPPSLSLSFPGAEKGYTELKSQEGSAKVCRVLVLRFHVSATHRPDVKGDGIPITGNMCTLVLARDKAFLHQTIQRMRGMLALVGCLTLAAVWMAVWWAVGRGLLPLSEFAAQVAAIDRTSLDTRLQTTTLFREFTPVAEKLNGLLARLEEAFAKERRFSADVSHELRTPIAEVKCAVEVLLREAGQSQDNKLALNDILASARHMESLVNVLLEIVRSERQAVPLPSAPLDIASLAQCVWINSRSREKAAEKNLSATLDLASPQPMLITSNEDLMRAVLANLLSNAVEYTPAGGSVAVACSVIDRATRLCIINDAPDLRPEDLPRLFDRFWRKDGVRGDSEHFGLGLPLAKTICERLGIELSASMSADGRLHMTLAFPAMPGQLKTSDSIRCKS